ncbi:MAG: metalloregulator ArsR/SmtB family transcription factor [Terriglobia bacterium]|jgi:DNA-binding transcriptional ArsR family regulator
MISSNRKVIEAVARRFKVLGEPQRLLILQSLESGEKAVGRLVTLLGANQPNVSRHLQALFDAGLVARRRNGNTVTYSVSDPMVFKLCELVCDNVVEQARAGMAEMALGGDERRSARRILRRRQP